MKTLKVFFAATGFALAALLLAGAEEFALKKVSPKPAKASAPAVNTFQSEKVAVAADLPVIVHLEKRGQWITVKAGPKGPVFTVTSKDGKMVHQNLTEKEMQAKAPELFQFYKTGMAGGAQKNGSWVDARSGLVR